MSTPASAGPASATQADCAYVQAPPPRFAMLVRWPALRLTQQPWFWIALALKLVCGTLLASHYLRDLFAPFLNYFVESGFQNPWAHFAAAGHVNSFPYPPVMLYLLALPRWLFSPLLASGTGTVTAMHLFVLRLPLLAADLGIALLLAHWYPDRIKRVLSIYWCSPIAFYICYWHGQLDVIPSALFLASLLLIQQDRPLTGMALLGATLATKSHLWVAVPFLLVYLNGQRGTRTAMRGATAAFAVYLLCILPYASDPAFRQMVFASPEQHRLFANQIPFQTGQFAFLLAPGAMVFLWFRFSAYEHRNWDLLMLYLGILFSLFLLLAPPQPGYFLWSLPFLAHYFCRSPRVRLLPYALYGLSYVCFFWLGPESDFFDAFRITSARIAALPSPHTLLDALDPAGSILARNLCFTVMEASLAGIVLYMYVLGVRSNAAYKLRTAPVLIGVAGDSGAGKDTVTRLFTALLGERNTTVIAGDDYHRWPRGHEMWQRRTHLDVRSNQLYEQQHHAVALLQGNPVVKSTYDHHSGRFTAKQSLEPKHVVIFQGLHALSTVALRDLYDLKIFLDPAEDLRHDWKIRRDCGERGYSPEEVLRLLDRRSRDRERYILPQREQADIVVRWFYTAASETPGTTAAPHLGLEVVALNSFDLTGLVEACEQQPGISVLYDPYRDAHRQVLQLQGEIGPSRIAELAQQIAPEVAWYKLRPAFSGDLPGCLQLVLLACLHTKLRLGGHAAWWFGE